MVCVEFLNRENEIAALEGAYRDGGFVPIYGRRRVGKTRLIEEFMEGKAGVYYLAAQEPTREQVTEFKALLAEELGDDYLWDAEMTSWKELFSYLSGNADLGKMVLAIDEATYVIRKDASFPSQLQKFWDGYLKDTDTCLLLSGSMVGLLRDTVLSHSSPLYGRRTGQIHLRPLRFGDILPLMSDVEKTVKLYSVFGGIPKYYEEIDIEDSFTEIIDHALRPESFFYEEGTFLLTQEFKELGNYNSILKALSRGRRETGEIADSLGDDSRKVASYLDTLHEVGLIRKEKPVTSTKKRFRGHRYAIEDNFLDFWFTFVFRNRSRIQRHRLSYTDIDRELNRHIARKFEEVCRERVEESGDYGLVGRWWYGEDEIDIVALDEAGGEILLGEAKWTAEPVGTDLLRRLEEKAGRVRWGDEDRNEVYALFSKGDFTETLVDEAERRDDLKLYGLNDLTT